MKPYAHFFKKDPLGADLKRASRAKVGRLLEKKRRGWKD